MCSWNGAGARNGIVTENLAARKRLKYTRPAKETMERPWSTVCFLHAVVSMLTRAVAAWKTPESIIELRQTNPASILALAYLPGDMDRCTLQKLAAEATDIVLLHERYVRVASIEKVGARLPKEVLHALRQEEPENRRKCKAEQAGE